MAGVVAIRCARVVRLDDGGRHARAGGVVSEREPHADEGGRDALGDHDPVAVDDDADARDARVGVDGDDA